MAEGEKGRSWEKTRSKAIFITILILSRRKRAPRFEMPRRAAVERRVDRGRKARRDGGVKKKKKEGRKLKNIREWNTKWAGGDETERDNCGEG